MKINLFRRLVSRTSLQMYYCRYQTCKKVQQCQYQTYKTWSTVNNIIWSRLQGLQTLYPRASFHVSGWNFPVHKYYVSLSEKHIVSSCTMTTFPCKQMNIHQDNFTPTGSLTRKKTVIGIPSDFPKRFPPDLILSHIIKYLSCSKKMSLVDLVCLLRRDKVRNT